MGSPCAPQNLGAPCSWCIPVAGKLQLLVSQLQGWVGCPYSWVPCQLRGLLALQQGLATPCTHTRACEAIFLSRTQLVWALGSCHQPQSLGCSQAARRMETAQALVGSSCPQPGSAAAVRLQTAVLGSTILVPALWLWCLHMYLQHMARKGPESSTTLTPPLLSIQRHTCSLCCQRAGAECCGVGCSFLQLPRA